MASRYTYFDIVIESQRVGHMSVTVCLIYVRQGIYVSITRMCDMTYTYFDIVIERQRVGLMSVNACLIYVRQGMYVCITHDLSDITQVCIHAILCLVEHSMTHVRHGMYVCITHIVSGIGMYVTMYPYCVWYTVCM